MAVFVSYGWQTLARLLLLSLHPRPAGDGPPTLILQPPDRHVRSRSNRVVLCLRQGEAEAEHQKEHLLVFLTGHGCPWMAFVWLQKCACNHITLGTCSSHLPAFTRTIMTSAGLCAPYVHSVTLRQSCWMGSYHFTEEKLEAQRE